MVVQNVEQERLSRLEGTYEQVDRRLDDLHQAIGGVRAETHGLRAEVNRRFGEVNGRFESIQAEVQGLRAEMNGRFESLQADLNSRFNMLMVVMIGGWATIIAAIIAAFITIYFK